MIKNSLTIILFSFFSSNILAEKILVTVPGMVCQMCVKGMQKEFNSVVKNAKTDIQVNLKEKTVLLKTKDLITDDQIINKVKKVGYTVSKILRGSKITN